MEDNSESKNLDQTEVNSKLKIGKFIVLGQRPYFTIIDKKTGVTSLPYFGISKVNTSQDESQTTIEHTSCNIILTGTGLKLLHKIIIEENLDRVFAGIPFVSEDILDKGKLHVIEDVAYVDPDEK